MQVIQRLQRKNTQRGSMYTIGYFLYDTEYASNQYYYGDSAASWTGDANAIVYEANYVRDEASQHWNLFLTAISSDFNWANMRISETTNRSMSEGSIIVYPSWFGVRVANLDDVSKGLRNLLDAPCKSGDYIFKNSTSNVYGSPDYSEAPFTTGKMQDAFGVGIGVDGSKIIRAINQKPTVYVYKVDYVDTRGFSSLQGWNGVNGTFGSGVAPSDTQTGRWKALQASVQQYKSQGGTTKNKVIRTCQSAPTLEGIPMIWDAKKNGGTWTW